MSLKSVRAPATLPLGPPRKRGGRALERVKEAVALAPSHRWNVAKLAEIANLSPFHLCHVFRDTVGTSIYDYVLL
jgi:AraC-like DNA-binding protein